MLETMTLLRQRLFVVGLIILLFGCSEPPDSSKARLSLSHRVFYFNPEITTQSLVISNIGNPGSILRWRVQYKDPNIIVAHGGQGRSARGWQK